MDEQAKQPLSRSTQTFKTILTDVAICFLSGSNMNSVIASLSNIFISNLVVDAMLQGLRSGYKFEIITDKPDAIAGESMTKLKRGATLFHAEGMYTHSEKSLAYLYRKKTRNR